MTGGLEEGRAKSEREAGSIERAGKQNTKRIYLWRLSKQETPRERDAFRADLDSSFFFSLLLFRNWKRIDEC